MGTPLDTTRGILGTLETLYYAERYRGELFFVYLDTFSELDEHLLDLRALEVAGIRLVLVLRGGSLVDIEEYRTLGYPLFPLEVTPTRPASSLNSLLFSISELHSESKIPTLLDTSKNEDRSSMFVRFRDLVQNLEPLRPRKIFFVSSLGALQTQAGALSHLGRADLHGFISSGGIINLSNNDLKILLDLVEHTMSEVVFVENKLGQIFQEIFTHQGAGTLIAKSHDSVIRSAQVSDIRDIVCLMRPWIDDGVILPTSEDDLAREINLYQVYTVNGQVVVSARWKRWGEAVEIGRICGLPRYHGKGRAQALVKSLMEEAKSSGSAYVFALSVSKRMERFFVGLGFQPVQRETLPGEWRSGYDLTRESKAFRYEL